MLKISPAQCKAARALIDLKQPDLAEAAGLGLSTVVDFERERRQVSEEAVDALVKALRNAGVEFIPENGGGAGVRLKKVLRSPEEIAAKIEKLDAKAAALKHDGTPSPDNALKTMDRALVKGKAHGLRKRLAKEKGK